MAICDSVIGKVPSIWAVCKAKDTVGDTVEGAANDAWSNIVHSFADAAAKLIETLATGWLGLDSPTLSADGGPVAFMFARTQWLTSWVAVLTLLIAAGRMAWSQRAEPAKEAAMAILRLIIAGSAAVAGVNLLLEGGDRFAVWIVNESTQCGGGDQATAACTDAFMNSLVTASILAPQKSEMLGLVLVFALLLIIASLAQIGFLLCRNAMLIVLVSTLPLSAAASGTPAGRSWFSKSTAWLTAFVLYKPVAAIVYAAAFASITKGGDGADGTDLMVQISGVVLIILAALTLPALMRIATPLVESVAQGRGGSGGAVLGAAGTIATGAVALKTGGASTAAGSAAKGGGSGAAQGSQMPGSSGGGRPGQGARPAETPQASEKQPFGSSMAKSPAIGAPAGGQGGGSNPAGSAGGSGSTRQDTARVGAPRTPGPQQSEEGPSGSN
ncbi:hypothetical protein [Streptomyces pseudovenezuelae]|uniref:hypothetical protein n=1 Tax=Streptomyces pseudovenezuelae TaxID=67350 RepID=UPI0036E3734F